MTFNGSALTSTESEVMIRNVVTNVFSCNSHAAYGRHEHTQTNQMRGSKGRWPPSLLVVEQRGKDVSWLIRDPDPSRLTISYPTIFKDYYARFFLSPMSLKSLSVFFSRIRGWFHYLVAAWIINTWVMLFSSCVDLFHLDYSSSLSHFDPWHPISSWLLIKGKNTHHHHGFVILQHFNWVAKRITFNSM